MSCTIFVEGGGKSKDLRPRCRDGFAQFLEPLSRAGRRPKIVACGTRADAFKRLRIALDSQSPGSYLLLVDSEAVVSAKGSVWTHVGEREGDNWQRPVMATEDQLHFMAVCMESWLLAAPESLANFYGQNFRKGSLPKATDLESIDKGTILRALRLATCGTSKGEYSKGKVSFAALAAVDVSVVRKRMSFCNRFANQLEEVPGL